MKKLLALVLILTLVLTMFAGCGEDAAKESADPELLAEIFADIEPLDDAHTLNMAASTATTAGFVMWFANELGAFDAANIDAELLMFSSGPVMMEAVSTNAWDVAQFGIGGSYTGTIGYDVINVAVGSRDWDSLRIYAPNDSSLVASGQVTGSASELYGTYDDWYGTEVFLPVGTTLHYTLAVGLDHYGISDSEVQITHMEVASINTALRAGQCDLGAVWGNYSYGDLNDDFTAVMTADDVGAHVVTAWGVNPSSYSADPELCEKWMEICFAMIDWLDDEDNIAAAAEYYIEWNMENGVMTTEEEAILFLTNNSCYTLEENYELFNSPGELGSSEAADLFISPLVFFVENESYTQADLDKYSKDQYIDGSMVDSLYNK